jgi:hydrogenase maturation protease
MNPLIIGIGHAFRRDDGIGPAVAEACRRDGLEILIHHGEGMDLMERWSGRDRVVLVDATVSGAPPGTVRVWDASAADLPSGLFPKGSHVIGPAEGIRMARLLGRLPESLWVVGVEGADFSAGVELTDLVAAALPEAVAAVERAVGFQE